MLQTQKAVNLVGFDVHLVVLHERNIIRVDLSSPIMYSPSLSS